jgi:Subtilase family/Fibronectin type III domain
MFSRARLVLAGLLALFITLGAMPTQAYAAVVRTAYIVQTTAAGQDAVLKEIFGFGEVPLDQLDLVMDGFTVPLTEYEASLLAANPNVLQIQPDQKTILLETQTPTPSWGLDRIDQQSKALDSKYNYPVDGGKGVRVYVVDTGVAANNPDFEGRMLPGFDTFGENLSGTDCHGHGTHVAGTAAGTKFGVAKAASIVPVRVLACSGSGSTSGILKAMDWILANHPAGTPGLVSMSIGGPGQPLFNAGIKKVYDAGILPIVAAGNSNANACNYSPAGTPEAFTVGASDVNDSRASYSNYGDCVDIFAPGSSIVSASASNPAGSTSMSGTSMATPHVSGLAALYLAQNPTATPAQVISAIRDNGILNAINNAQSQFGNILINNNFIRGAAPVTPNPNPVLNAPDQVASVTVTSTSANSGTVSWVDGASDGGSPITGHVIRALAPGAIFAIANSVRGANVTSYTLNGLEANTEYTFSVYAYNDIGSGKVSAGVIAKTAIGAPTPPAGLVAKPGSTTASLTWTPSNDGGSPITWFAIETYSAATGTWTTAGTSTSPSITLTGLTSGANYIARVRANNALGASSASKSVSFTTDAGAPDVPTGLTVVKVTDGSATVAWNPVSSTSPNLAVSYIVSFAIESSTLMQHVNSATPTATLSPLAAGRKYSFTVRAQVGTTVSASSTPATFTTTAVAPGAPAGVQVSGNSGTQVLRWYSSDDGGSPIISYVIETSGPLSSSSAPVTSWTTFAEQTGTSINLPAAPVAKYVRYRVLAKNAVGTSLPSINVTITTAAGKPGAPTGLTASEPNAAGMTTLRWVAPTSDGGVPLTGYTAMVSRDGKTWSSLGSVSATTLSYQTSRPTKGQTWSYAVYSRNASGASAYSAAVSLSTATSVPGVVSGLRASLTGTDSVTVSWYKVYDDGGLLISSYTVQSLTDGVWSTLAQVSATTFSHTVKRPQPGQYSTFRVFATNSLGDGPISATGSVMTPFLQASAPQNFAASYNSATGRVDVSYAAPTSLGGSTVSGYVIQVSKDGGATWSSLTYPNATTFAVAVPAPLKGQTWSYRVIATTRFGSSQPSAAVSIAVANAAPSQMSAPSILLTGTNEVTVRWNPVSDNGGLTATYNLERQVDGAWASVAQLPATTLIYVTTRPAPGAYATFRISAVNAIGAGPVSATASLMTPYAKAGAPQNFVATLNTATKRIDVSFTAPTDLGGGVIRSYYLQYSKDAGKTWLSQTTLTSTSASGVMSAPAKGQTLSYRVVPYTQFGLGEPSNSVTLSTGVSVPGQVFTPSVSFTGTADLTVRWSAPSDNGGTAITGYVLERQVDGVWSSVAQLSATTLTYVTQRPAPGVYSTYRVSAVNATGAGAASSAASIMTPYSKASAPQSFVATLNTATNRYDISFAAPADLGGGSVRSYYLQYSRDAGKTWYSQSTFSTTSAAGAFTPPAKGQTVSYRVVAYTQFGLGQPSNVVTVSTGVTAPGQVYTPSVSLTGAADVTVRWNAPNDNGGSAITGYLLERQVDGAWSAVGQLPATTLTYTVARPIPGVYAIFRVTATNAVGSGPVSAVGAVMSPYLQASAPQSFTAVQTSTGVTLSYTAPVNLGGGSVRGYSIQVSRDAGVTWQNYTSSTGLTLNLPAPTKGQTWQYRAIALTQYGSSLPSGSAAISMPTTVPSAPQSVGYVFNSDNTVTVRWAAPYDNGGLAITGYKVQKQNGGTWVDVADSTALSIVVPKDQPGVRSYFRVIAFNALGASAVSYTMSYAIPAAKASPVQNVTVTASTSVGYVQVNYAAPSNFGGGSFYGYYTYVSRDSGATWVLIGSTTATSVRVSGPAAGLTWLYRVAANTSAGVGEASAPVSYTGN